MRVLLTGAILAAALAAAAVALGRDATANVAFPRGTATIWTATTSIPLRVELARTVAQRQQGLMGRRSLAANAGMVFQYPTASRGGFWMKDTLIALDIAFYDARGRILRIMQMKPCAADPCRVYDPQVAYRGALEVNRGSFRRWGVRRGDRIVVSPARGR
jgi:uncharacterized protein